MPKIVFTALILLISFASFGQDYVVTLKSDTLKGNVKLLSYDLLDRLQLQEEGKKKTTYTAVQVRTAFIRGEHYAPVKFDNGIRMMKVIRTGFLSLYGYRAPGQASYETRILQKMGSNPIEVPNIGFKKFVGELVADCPTVSDKVKSGGYDRNSVESLVDEYNVCVSEGNTRRIAAATGTPATRHIDQMKVKVNASDLANKSDVNDLLTSIADRLKKNEAVPAYMREGLKGYIGEREDLKTDMEQLFNLIDK